MAEGRDGPDARHWSSSVHRGLGSGQRERTDLGEILIPFLEYLILLLNALNGPPLRVCKAIKRSVHLIEKRIACRG